MTDRLDLLSLALSPELLAALEERMREIAVEAVREELGRQRAREWLPIVEAAERYGCSREALAMRARRGSVPFRRVGRLLYVPAVPPDNGAGVP